MAADLKFPAVVTPSGTTDEQFARLTGLRGPGQAVEAFSGASITATPAAPARSPPAPTGV